MSQKNLFTKSALAVAVAIVSTQAWSAGFQLNEFSSSGLGRAYSGEGAIADDAGNASRNPALIMMFDRPTSPRVLFSLTRMLIFQARHRQVPASIRKILRQQHGFQTSFRRAN
jgi:long-subunit fatty acid transport protein